MDSCRFRKFPRIFFSLSYNILNTEDTFNFYPSVGGPGPSPGPQASPIHTETTKEVTPR